MTLYIGQHKDHQAQLAAFNGLDALTCHCYYHWSFLTQRSYLKKNFPS